MEYRYFDPKQSALDEARSLLGAAAAAAMECGDLPQRELPDFITEIPNDSKNGDVASNLAMASARVFGMAPRKIAEAVAAHVSLEGSHFERIEIAGPGFINLFLSASWFADTVLAANLVEDYGRTQAGKVHKYNVEFVSANPTGPMHLGNARGAALGDCLAAALDWAGYDVTREFLINDAGNQVMKFGKSLAARYLQIFKGEDAVEFPADGYQGDDIRVRAKESADEVGDRYVDAPEEELQKAIVAYALPKNVQGLKDDLAKYRVHYDVWFSETTLHESGAVKDVLDKLAERGATYEKDGAIWYRSTQYSAKYGANKNARKGLGGEVNEEEKDEVLVRANGVPTYFAADIAYHYNKFAVRGFERAIDVWGADHHGHVARMKGAMDALGLDGEKLDVVLMQFVRLVRGGEHVRMSKRTGKAITLTDLLDEVPIDSARFLFNLREPGSAMDFDLDLAVAEDNDNPVYYVQYAHARICSILKKLAADGVEVLAPDQADLTVLTEPSERELIRCIAAFPGEIVSAAKNYDPARLTRYASELATQYHKFYNTCRVSCDDKNLCSARAALCTATRNVLRNVLTMMKITVPESM